MPKVILLKTKSIHICILTKKNRNRHRPSNQFGPKLKIKTRKIKSKIFFKDKSDEEEEEDNYLN